MVDKVGAPYLYKKRGVYYFSKQVPYDIRQHYCRDRIVLSLRTKSFSVAKCTCQSMLQRLEDYWLSLRLSVVHLPGHHLLQGRPRDYDVSKGPFLSDALQTYLRLKGRYKDKTFNRAANRNIGTVIDHLGDRSLEDYTSADAAALRDVLLEKGLAVASIRRNFSTIRVSY